MDDMFCDVILYTPRFFFFLLTHHVSYISSASEMHSCGLAYIYLAVLYILRPLPFAGAVIEAFVRLHEKGLIYQGITLVVLYS